MTFMKTTLEIPGSLLREARELAAREHLSLEALVAQGLRRMIAERQQRPVFRLRKASFKGRGLQPSLRGASWARVRDKAYES
jgi:hypothetical protein